VEELTDFANKARAASSEFSGVWFLSGLAKHQQAAEKLTFNDFKAVESLENLALDELNKAIDTANTKERSDRPEFIHLYYTARSAARLILAERFYQQHREAKLAEYRSRLEDAVNDARDALNLLKSQKRTSWYPFIPLANALEDLAWRCYLDDPAREKAFQDADDAFARAMLLSQGLQAEPIIGRARALYRRARTDGTQYLEKAEGLLHDATTRFASDKQIGEAHIWRALVCLKLGGKARYETAIQSIARAAEVCDASWAGVLFSDVADLLIRQAIRLGGGRSGDQAQMLLERFRNAADLVAKRLPEKRAAALLAKVRAYESENDFEQAGKCYDEALTKKPNLPLWDHLRALSNRIDLALNKGVRLDYDQLIKIADDAATSVGDGEPEPMASAKYCQAAARALRAIDNSVTKAKDRDEAFVLIKDSIKLDSSTSEIPQRRLLAATVSLSLGKRAEAREFANAVLGDAKANKKQKEDAQTVVNLAQ
jgi:hypothetical protein